MTTPANSLLQDFRFKTEICAIEDQYGTLQVYDDGDERYLMFGSIFEQSCQRKSDPAWLVHEYARAMVLSLLFVTPRHATVLGLGGASLVNCLFRRYPQLDLQVVDIRQAVIELAYAHFQVPQDPRLNILLQDAGDYLRQAPAASTDLLLCDLYNAQGLDNQQLRPAFLERCKRLLRPGGWVAFNYLQSHRIYGQTLDTLRGLFNTVYSCNISSGNWVVMAGDLPAPLSSATLRVRAQHLEQHLSVPLHEHLERLERERG